jgi:purine-binding chemotaxis protein CheW
MTQAEELVADLEDENLDHMHLIFTVNTEAYGVQIEYVTEIVGLQKIVEVPDVPTYIKGVINLRGQVIPVMDVRIRFNMPIREYDDRTVIIVLEHNDVKTGLIVDGVSDVQELSDNEISPPPRKDEANNAIITGVGQKDDKISFLLDVERLLYAKDSGG